MGEGKSPTLFLTDADVHALLDWREVVQALKQAYSVAIDEAMLPPRSLARGPGYWLRTMTGVLPGSGLMGAKHIAASVRPGNNYGSYLIPLFDSQTTQLVGLIDGHTITGTRTAATSAVAVDMLARPGSLRIAVIGSGYEAQMHVRALAAIRELREVKVFSPNPKSRAAFIDLLEDLGIAMSTAESARAATEEADVVICAARSRDETPTLQGAWLKLGMTIVSIGSTLPEQREIDPEAIARADLIVADMVEEVAEETGDMIAATDAGIEFRDKLIGLGELVAGMLPGRTDPDQIILYKSVGGALQDLAVAAMCLRKAQVAGIGTALPVTVVPVKKG